MRLPFLDEDEARYIYQTQRELLNDGVSDNFEEKVWYIMVAQKASNGDPLYRDWRLNGGEGSFLDLALKKIAERARARTVAPTTQNIELFLSGLTSTSHTGIQEVLLKLSKAQEEGTLDSHKPAIDTALLAFARHYEFIDKDFIKILESFGDFVDPTHDGER